MKTGTKGTRDQGNKGAREQGSEGAKGQGVGSSQQGVERLGRAGSAECLVGVAGKVGVDGLAEKTGTKKTGTKGTKGRGTGGRRAFQGYFY